MVTDTPFNTGLPANPTLTLQRCGECGQVNYPPRELCGGCLADALSWQPVDDNGTVQSLSELHYSLEPRYAEKLPWAIASVRLACGPIVISHLLPGVAVGTEVRLRPVVDTAGTVMLLAAGRDSDRALSNWLAATDFREVQT
jgi:uncharacterized OB-fold protein